MLILIQRLLAEKLAASPPRARLPRPPAVARAQPAYDAVTAAVQSLRASVAPAAAATQATAATQPAVTAQAQAETATQVADAEAAPAYYVYTNSRNRYSRVHEASCPWYKRPRTSRQTDNGWWHGPYGHRDQAEASPQNIGPVAPCGHCLH